MGSSVDVSDLLRIIRNLQEEDIQCPSCFIYYTKKWCTNVNTSCFFCTHFVLNRDRYEYILENIDWYFINSDEQDHAIFCKEFKYNLRRWFSEFPVLTNYVNYWMFQ